MIIHVAFETRATGRTDVWYSVEAKAVDSAELFWVSQRENEGRGLIGTPDNRVFLQGKYVSFLLLHAHTEV